jgi:hypothetical protein
VVEENWDAPPFYPLNKRRHQTCGIKARKWTWGAPNAKRQLKKAEPRDALLLTSKNSGSVKLPIFDIYEQRQSEQLGHENTQGNVRPIQRQVVDHLKWPAGTAKRGSTTKRKTERRIEPRAYHPVGGTGGPRIKRQIRVKETLLAPSRLLVWPSMTGRLKSKRMFTPPPQTANASRPTQHGDLLMDQTQNRNCPTRCPTLEMVQIMQILRKGWWARENQGT